MHTYETCLQTPNDQYVVRLRSIDKQQVSGKKRSSNWLYTHIPMPAGTLDSDCANMYKPASAQQQ